ncbi:hypothetical protein BAWEI_46670 [Bacillus mycoides]|uniref:Uncharacterized protein n=1 Tax=Bacillus mycoides TaxID=1405 RepID=A0AAP8H0R6_BACMY|nr:hypothetical protein BAWEI_46670 [Bacillus mycoides]PJN70846.1 hypothetical protein BACWE_22390 [Bacillus mycoides]
MNLSIQDELQPFAEELQRYVTPVFLEELAKKTWVCKAKTQVFWIRLSCYLYLDKSTGGK